MGSKERTQLAGVGAVVVDDPLAQAGQYAAEMAPGYGHSRDGVNVAVGGRMASGMQRNMLTRQFFTPPPSDPQILVAVSSE